MKAREMVFLPRVTNCPSLPGTGGFPGTQNLSANTWDSPRQVRTVGHPISSSCVPTPRLEGTETLIRVKGQELWPRDTAHPTHGTSEERAPSPSMISTGHRAKRRAGKNGVLILPGMASGLDLTS